MTIRRSSRLPGVQPRRLEINRRPPAFAHLNETCMPVGSDQKSQRAASLQEDANQRLARPLAQSERSPTQAYAGRRTGGSSKRRPSGPHSGVPSRPTPDERSEHLRLDVPAASASSIGSISRPRLLRPLGALQGGPNSLSGHAGQNEYASVGVGAGARGPSPPPTRLRPTGRCHLRLDGILPGWRAPTPAISSQQAASRYEVGWGKPWSNPRRASF
jgi:hypothetical protein